VIIPVTNNYLANALIGIVVVKWEIGSAPSRKLCPHSLSYAKFLVDDDDLAGFG
jgi:hypothetical protein